jgi:peptide deformylase
MDDTKVRVYGDAVLRRKAKPVEEIDSSIEELVDRMFVALEEEGGIGLAAPQIGVSKRVIIVSIPDDAGGRVGLTLVNPVITSAEGTQEFEEGCLSVPGIYETVQRKAKITIEGRLLNGSSYEAVYEGFPATVFQHEIDHLDGVLFVDRLSRMKRRLLEKKLAEISRSSLQVNGD